MIAMSNLVDLRMHQHIVHEFYRQQVVQRIPDPFSSMLPFPIPHRLIMPVRITLLSAEVTLQNDDLWQQFHHIGTEMIITKSGRRMFPSLRLTIDGLDEEPIYCVLLEMVPVGDCRFKFSGSQWVPAGGAEPQSPQRMFLHPDSPATGVHWQAQPILFNKVKLTNNTLDNNGHIVLASMHKYQPRIHVIRTADLSQIPWAPQQAFVFSETEFVAVTAYQNDRITRLKIDNNPFAKGFRDTGQSRCKRKISTSPSDEYPKAYLRQQLAQQNDNYLARLSDGNSMCCASAKAERRLLLRNRTAVINGQQENGEMRAKRPHSNGCAFSRNEIIVSGVLVDDGYDGDVGAYDFPATKPSSNHDFNATKTPSASAIVHYQRQTSAPSPPPQPRNVLVAANEGVGGVSMTSDGGIRCGATSSIVQCFQQNMQSLLPPSVVNLAYSYFGRTQPLYYEAQVRHSSSDMAAAIANEHGTHPHMNNDSPNLPTIDCSTESAANEPLINVSLLEVPVVTTALPLPPDDYSLVITTAATSQSPKKRKGFSISAILES